MTVHSPSLATLRFHPAAGQLSRPSLTRAVEELDAGVYDAIWSEAMRRKIRGSAGKATVHYGNLALDHIFCDVAEFKQKWLWYRDRKTFPSAFKDWRAFDTWYSQVRSLMDAAGGDRARREAIVAGGDAWSDLLDAIEGKEDVPTKLNKGDRVELGVLAQVCRPLGILPSDLNAERVTALAPGLTDGQKSAVRRATRTLYSFQGMGIVPDELLPHGPIGALPVLTNPQRRQTPEMVPTLAAQRDAYLDERGKGTERLALLANREISTGGVGEERVKAIKQSIGWYYHGVVQLGLVDPEADAEARDLADPMILLDVIQACARGELGGSVSSSTRRGHAKTTMLFLAQHCPDFDKVVIASGMLKDVAVRRNDREDEQLDALKRAFCLEMIRERARRAKFYGMPIFFFAPARPMMERFDQMKPVPGTGLMSREQHLAIDFGIMAALTAIQTRLPLRLNSAQGLIAFGKDQHIFFPPDSRDVTLCVPGHLVKNGASFEGVPLIPSRKVSPREILGWYLETVHPLVIRHKVKGIADPRLLFGGLCLDTLRKTWGMTARAGCYMTPHMVRHVTASLLYADGVPLERVAELLGDTVATVAKRYAFIDRKKIIEEVMAKQAKNMRELGL